MKIAIYGSSLVSSYWNGAATYYRGILRALAAYGHSITFYEPDAYGRQDHRDIDPPHWCNVVVYPATGSGLAGVLGQAFNADVVIKASGVGVFDDELMDGIVSLSRPGAVRLFWDVDAPATLAEIGGNPGHPVRRALPYLDAVLTYGGGDPVIEAYASLGARMCVPIYNALDPSTHHPVALDNRFRADLTFLGNRLPDRERRVETFFLAAAARLPDRQMLLGGAGWEDKDCPPNVQKLGHVPTEAHNALNVSARAILNISRDSMATIGFSPATRVFEAAGAGACILTDPWPGIDMFLTPGKEVLVVRDGLDVAEAVQTLTAMRAAAIGQAALRRVLTEHTYDRRARLLDGLLTDLAGLRPAA
ncbi:MAG: glycosyltransferase [Acetobacteraceae bacterium]